MNILHVSYHKSWRGGEQQITYLADELHKAGCSQWVFCTKGNALEKYCENNGLPFYTFPDNFISRFYNVPQLKKICQKHFIDIIHVHDAISHQIVYIAGTMGNNVPVVVSRRVDIPVKKNKFSQGKYNYPQLKKIICVSNKIKNTLTPDIEDPEKLTVIYDGIDINRFDLHSDKNILRKQYNLNENTKLVGYISALAPLKDHHTFIDTAKILVEQNTDARFFIIGEGNIRKDLETYANQLGLSDNIIFTGFRDDVTHILPGLDIFLFTSLSEGLGTSILDAFASGVPVVSTNAGGIPEIIQDGVNGFITDTGDSRGLAEKVKILLSSEELRKKIIDNALSRVKDFSKEIMAVKTLEIYQSIIQ